jgi:hypothetical protein
MEEIMQGIRDTAAVESIIRPIYNFKAGEDSGRNKRRS